jgi:hypothetical protein
VDAGFGVLKSKSSDQAEWTWTQKGTLRYPQESTL